jgi:hypothetical protein
VEPGEAEFDSENKPDVDDIVSVCAGLVVVDQESAIIRLVHYTTQEYFERISSRLNPNAQLEIAETCLTYLSFSVFASDSRATDEEFEERLCQHELLDYAAKHCGEHTRSVDVKVAYSVCTLFTHSGLFSCAVQVLFVPIYRFKGYSRSNPAVTGLHWTARVGLCDAAKEFLRRKDDETSAVNATDSDGEDSLMYAVKHGHCAMAELLLGKGADVNDQGGPYGKALQAAAYAGNTEVLERLIEKDSISQLQDPYDRTLLWWAAAGGQSTTVQVLISRYNYDSRIADKFGRTPLWIATKKGHYAVSELLFEECGPTDPGQTASPDHRDDLGSMQCDVCTSSIRATDFHYHCQHCSNGDWDVCEDCRVRGAFCAEETHILVKRTRIDQKWVEMTC